MAQSQTHIAKASRHTAKPRQSLDRGLTPRALNIPNPPPTQNRDANTPRDSDSAISQRHTIRASHIKTIWHILDSTINACPATRKTINQHCPDYRDCWAEAREKIARMTLTIKLDRNWSSFQLANSTPPLSVTGSAIAPSARIVNNTGQSIFHPHMFVATRRAGAPRWSRHKPRSNKNEHCCLDNYPSL